MRLYFLIYCSRMHALHTANLRVSTFHKSIEFIRDFNIGWNCVRKISAFGVVDY